MSEIEDTRWRAKNRSTMRAYQRQWEAENREKRAAQKKAWRERNPQTRPKTPRTKAHKAVEQAIRTGRLVRPDKCEDCARVTRVQGHHDDYAKPLEVRWLCGSCHGLIHKGVTP